LHAYTLIRLRENKYYNQNLKLENMKKLILLLKIFFLICYITSANAQDLLKIDNMTVLIAEQNNVTIQIEVEEQPQNFLSQINQTNVNQKNGFHTQFNSNNTLLTINFTKPFNEVELETLLEYCGFKLDIASFNQLKNLLNQ